jgi:broad specificity phosphatase PhoE
MKTLYFMRHGLTEMNAAGKWSGSTETILTKEGREQAIHAGKAAKGLGIDTIVCSTMVRAVETAEIVAKEIGYPLDKIHKSSLLIERHFGELEGQPYQPDLNLDGFSDVESLDTLKNRALLALEWIETIPGNTILVVSHGSTGRMLRHIVNPTVPFSGAGHFPNAEIRKIERDQAA